MQTIEIDTSIDNSKVEEENYKKNSASQLYCDCCCICFGVIGNLFFSMLDSIRQC